MFPDPKSSWARYRWLVAPVVRTRHHGLRKLALPTAVAVTAGVLGPWAAPAFADVDPGTSGSAGAEAVHLSELSTTIAGVRVLSPVTADSPTLSAPAAGTDGAGQSSSTTGVAATGLTDSTVIARTVRRPFSLAANSEVDGFSLSVLGVTGLVRAGAVTSSATAPVAGMGSPTCSSTVTGLTVAGHAASVGSTVSVPVSLGLGALTSSTAYVTLGSPCTNGADSASGTGLTVGIRLKVVTSGSTTLDSNVVSVALAASSASRPMAPVPVVTGLAPTSGPVAGGTEVTVSGWGFLPNGTAASVDGTAVPAGQVTVNDAGTSATFDTPAHPAGPAAVVLTTAGGSSSPGTFTYVGPPPPPPVVDPPAPPAPPVDTPTDAPSGVPTDAPTDAPPAPPVGDPTDAPTAAPVDSPTDAPTAAPVGDPTDAPPVDSPTDAPTAAPVGDPTDAPTAAPVGDPTDAPPAPPVGDPTDAPPAPPAPPVVDPTGAPVPPAPPAPPAPPVNAPTGAPVPPAPPVNAPTGAPVPPAPPVHPAGPELLGMSPRLGPTAGGTRVTLTGNHFVPGSTSVMMNGVLIPASEVTVNEAGTTATFHAPPHLAGAVRLMVDVDGTRSGTGGYTYVPPVKVTVLPPVAQNAGVIDNSSAARQAVAHPTMLHGQPQSAVVAKEIDSEVLWKRSPTAGVTGYLVTVNGRSACSQNATSAATYRCVLKDEALSSADLVRISAVKGSVHSSAVTDPVWSVQDSHRLVAVIYLDKAKFALDSSDVRTLKAAAAVADRYGLSSVVFQGYTDSDGSNSYNMKLSMQRARQAASAYRHYSPHHAYQTRAHGESDPVASNGTDKGQSLNRRVEIYAS